ncbi:lipoprotein lipase [Culex quinquefasciatus]|uniref:Lipoprotein lipase n=1 Tax=Culex quinquefasciatus TaxID=7176 RepID=B0WH80_CULQU|nr:lipoprotein lipase [Culex quinquefasciatus]|eukprot:XP_001848045.1 lipoprotein lipase [Culex quinquefasciatus]
MQFLIIVLTISSSSAFIRTRRGLVDLFNISSEYNLAQLIEIVYGLAENTGTRIYCNETKVVPEQEIKFLCGHKGSPLLQDTILNDPRLASKIDVDKPIFFILHGWTDSGTKSWVQESAQNVIQFMDQNVCIVNWARLALFGYLISSFQHVPLVADYMTKFVEYIHDEGIPLSKFTLAGHSLGAQIAGQVGHKLRGQLGTIFGLDPARALFTAPIDRGLATRLDKTDAKYVQMILTSRGLGGVFKGDGHENFYPNGGFSPQLNCVIPVNSDAEFSIQLLCSHLHATELFKNSINPNIVFKARQCSDWITYVSKKCESRKTNRLGPYSDRIGGDFFLRTSAVAPYNV